jgi:hypothetical protein
MPARRVVYLFMPARRVVYLFMPARRVVDLFMPARRVVDLFMPARREETTWHDAGRFFYAIAMQSILQGPHEGKDSISVTHSSDTNNKISQHISFCRIRCATQ